MQQRVTMKPLQRPGYAATVSNVLNGKDKHVSQETIARITAIAARLGYQPLRNRAKSVRHLPCLGVITYNVTSPFFAAGLNGILTVADRLGFSVIVQSDFGREHQEINAAQMLIEQGVDGVVFLSSSAYSRDAAFKALVEAGIPIAVVNRLIDPDVAFHALIDNEQGGYIATQHLIELGHKNIGNIHMQANGPGATQAAADRLRGYYRALADYGLQPNPAGSAQSGLRFGYKSRCDFARNRTADPVGALIPQPCSVVPTIWRGDRAISGEDCAYLKTSP